MKTIWWISGMLCIAIIFCFGGIFLYKKNLIDRYDFDSKLVKGSMEYHYNSAHFTRREVSDFHVNFQQETSDVSELFNVKKPNKLHVLLPHENGISATYPYFNIMVLHHVKQHNSPTIHEYVHELLGVFKEEWFTEGFATYISLHLKKTNETLRNQHDMGDQWFDMLDYNDIPLTHLTKNYTPNVNSVEILNLGDKRTTRDQRKRKEFYMASASFVEYLVTKYGLQEIINI